jgi:hypothetical protein
MGKLIDEKQVPASIVVKAFNPLFTALKEYGTTGTRIPVNDLYKTAVHSLLANEHITKLRKEDITDLPLLPGVDKDIVLGILFDTTQRNTTRYASIKDVMAAMTKEEKNLQQVIPALIAEHHPKTGKSLLLLAFTQQGKEGK